jgi:hypothetical protein
LLSARYSRRVLNRIRIVPRQLVAVDSAPGTPEVVWRWFGGPVLMLVDSYAVVDYRVYQPGFRYPIGVTMCTGPRRREQVSSWPTQDLR